MCTVHIKLVLGRENVMKLDYNIYYEVAAAIFLSFLTGYVRLQYNMKLRSNRLFLRLALSILFNDILDIVTAFTISNADVLPEMLNMVINNIVSVIMCFNRCDPFGLCV